MFAVFLLLAIAVAYVAAVYATYKLILSAYSGVTLAFKRISAAVQCSKGDHDYQVDEYKLRLKSEVNLACRHCGDHRFVRYVEDWEYEQ